MTEFTARWQWRAVWDAAGVGTIQATEPPCEHLWPDDRGNFLVLPAPTLPGYLQVRCPCCGLRAPRTADDDLADDKCPYCDVQAEWAT